MQRGGRAGRARALGHSGECVDEDVVCHGAPPLALLAGRGVILREQGTELTL